MRYCQIRNATGVLELAGKRILVDPMLGAPGTLPPYALFRFKARRNPLTLLPDGWESTLQGVDACLISHLHFGLDCDHLDKAGAAWLLEHKVPAYCRGGDERRLRRRGLEAITVGEQPQPFFSGKIWAVAASHGRGLVGTAMGPGVGYLIESPDEPLVYLTGDTVLTGGVLEVVKTWSPEVCIVPGGGAQLDVGGPILMSLDELEAFVEAAPARVIINHIGALNHCPHTSEEILSRIGQELSARVDIPADGETVTISSS